MAFIDKCTTMRRFAIIDNYNGNIEYEGVWIEGKYLYKEVGKNGIYLTDYNPVSKGEDCNYENMIFVWEDGEPKEWIPRESCEKEYDEDGTFIHFDRSYYEKSK